MGWRVIYRSALAVSLLGSTAWVAGEAEAQQVFTSIQAFGDSYVDTGNALAILKNASPATYASLAPIYPTGRFSGGTNYVDTISSLLSIPQQNYAIGGAEAGTGNTITGLPGFAQEWQGFLASGARISPSDLVVLNIGGNDARVYYQGGGTLAGVATAATTSATQAITGINALVSAGARTLVYTGGDVSGLPEAAAYPNANVGSVYSTDYNQQVEAALGGLARNGTRVEYVDLTLLENEIAAKPGVYGLTSTGACPVTCVGNAALQNQYLYYVDGIHLTSHGFAILGDYVVNRLEAPGTLPSQGDVGSITEMAFAQTLFGRLDVFGGGVRAIPQRELADLPGPVAVPAPILSPPNPLSVVLLVDGGAGDGARSAAATGYTFNSIGGTVAAEYRVNDEILVGAAFNYSNPELKLSDGQTKTQADSYQFGLYGTWTTPTFFVQGLATGGFQSYQNTRAGVVSTINSDPSGNTFVVGGKVGRLFETYGLRVGPIAGLLYGRARVNGFAENGDPVLTLNVGSQTENTLIASGGGQIRSPYVFRGFNLDAFVNLTVESNVVGNGRIIQYGATSAPLIVNSLAVPTADSRRPYGRVAAGLSTPVTPSISLVAFATTTVDRPGGNDFSGNGGIKFAF